MRIFGLLLLGFGIMLLIMSGFARSLIGPSDWLAYLRRISSRSDDYRRHRHHSSHRRRRDVLKIIGNRARLSRLNMAPGMC